MRLSTLSRVVLVIFASTCALAQRYTFQLYGRAEGLTNLTPISVLQDRTGFLWVGTQNGLFRYDGSQFEAFNVAQGLPTSQVDSLYEDADGSILAATTGGLVRFSGNRFTRVAESITTARREGLASAEGRLYIATN